MSEHRTGWPEVSLCQMAAVRADAVQDADGDAVDGAAAVPLEVELALNEADLRATKAGKIVVKPGCDMKPPHELWSDPVEAEALKVRLDDLHRAKIRLADEVLVVGNYIGDSTRAEIAYARSLGKPARFTHPEVDPDA